MEQQGRVTTALTVGLVLVLIVLATVWGAFLVPLRFGGTLVPVALVIVVVANSALGVAAGRLLGRWGSAAAGLLWLVLAFRLSTPRPEGDLVISNSWVGVGYLLLGVVSAAVAFGLTPLKRLRVVAAVEPAALAVPLAGADRTA